MTRPARAPRSADGVDHLRLAVIGDTQHYRDAEGRLCALEPVVMQLDRWAALFDELVLCAPLDPGPVPVGFGPYRASNITIVPLPRGGGNTLWAKLGMLRLLPTWFLVTRRVARSVDAVHLRCPCNIGLIAIFSTWKATRFRHGFYAGVWRGYAGEPFFFGLQRRLLGSRWFDGPVSVYAGRQPDRPDLEPFFSPSYDLAYWEEAGPAAEVKVERLRSTGREGPWRFITVGRLTPNKNQRVIIQALAQVVGAGVDARLDVYGDGPCRPELLELAASLGIDDRVTFHGSVSHPTIMAAFASADLNILATRQEGFGKVLLEGMVHATVPVFSESPVADELAGGSTRGLVFDADDSGELAAHILSLTADPERWSKMAADARAFGREMTLDRFAGRVREMLQDQWSVRLPDPSEPSA
ncbi:glycosyltransferase family 4 protein [Aquihabitans daechungensis]|uniref:glycosyltransferase family 4 protein n=1 Tax=Aquihabitans daechungensis TaxID=1052257 RepID=UPI003B9E3633